MSLSQKLNNKLARSPLFYVGDKYKLLPQLLSLFPSDINRFIEPFTGGGSVAMNVGAKEYLLNDIDPNIVGIHDFLIKSSSDRDGFFYVISELIRQYDLSRSYFEDIVPVEMRAKWRKTYYAKFNEPRYKRLRNDYNKELNKDPYKLYLLLIYGFNRMIRFNSHGEFNVPVGNVDFNKNVVIALNSYFDWAQEKNIYWSNKDYYDFVAYSDYGPGDLIYMDPPYLITFSEYNKLWNIAKEVSMTKLLNSIDAKGARFAVSNVTHYKGRVNSVFLEWSKKYKVRAIKSNYISYHDNSTKKFKEVLVTNF